MGKPKVRHNRTSTKGKVFPAGRGGEKTYKELNKTMKKYWSSNSEIRKDTTSKPIYYWLQKFNRQGELVNEMFLGKKIPNIFKGIEVVTEF